MMLTTRRRLRARPIALWIPALLALASPSADAWQAVRTTEAAEKAVASVPLEAPREVLDAIEKLVAERSSRGLYELLTKRLAGGDTGRGELIAIGRALAANPTLAARIIGDHRLSFAITHAVMLHEDDAARFLHAWLLATRGDSSSLVHRRVLDFAPVFVRYHGARYPDLVEELRTEIRHRLGQVAAGKQLDLQILFAAIAAIEDRPPLTVLAAILERSQTLQESQLVLQHLERRDNRQSAAVVARFAHERRESTTYELDLALGTLARMTAPEADEALESWTSSNAPDALFRGAMAWFSVERPDSSLPVALRLLSHPDIAIGRKRSFLERLETTNLDLRAILQERADEIGSEEVRDLLR